MPCRIAEVNWITRNIGIAIPPALAERAPTVRAVEAHQHRAESPVAGPQQIAARQPVTRLAIETCRDEGLGSSESVGWIVELSTIVPCLPLNDTVH